MKQLIRHILREHSSEIKEMKKLTQDDFLKRAIERHGDRYDYSQVDYKNQRTDVDIICPIHGKFSQSPQHHMNGSGCPKCALIKEPLKWTDEELRKEALKYSSLVDFTKNSPSAYQIAKKKRSKEFFDSIISHMDKTIRWTDDMLKNEALKYKTRGEFQKLNPVAYTTSSRRGILDDITTHMERAGSKYKRLIYAYEFPDNSVYVGLTYNLDKRDFSHMNRETSSVYQYMKASGLTPVRKSLTEFLDKDEASKLEGKLLEKYRSEGWKILNRAKTGVLGGSALLWTPEKIQNVANEFDNLTDFYEKYPSAIVAAKKIGKEFYEKITSHIARKINKLTDEEIIKIARKFKNKMSFYKENPQVYAQAKRRGEDFFDKVTSHMVNQKIYWTDDMLEKEGRKYKGRTPFSRGNPSAYTTARRRGLLDKIFPNN